MLSDYREIRAERRPENVADLGGSCAGVQAAGVGETKEGEGWGGLGGATGRSAFAALCFFTL